MRGGALLALFFLGGGGGKGFAVFSFFFVWGGGKGFPFKVNQPRKDADSFFPLATGHLSPSFSETTHFPRIWPVP